MYRYSEVETQTMSGIGNAEGGLAKIWSREWGSENGKQFGGFRNSNKEFYFISDSRKFE